MEILLKNNRQTPRMPSSNSFAICPLAPPDAASVAAFLRRQPPEYLRFFYAFGAEETAIAEMLRACEKDIYSGVFWQETLIGVFMLRGWDEGFEIPSFGVLIDEKYRGGAFMRLTLDTAKLICRLSGAKKLMAKIHPDNVSPRGARRLGLHQTGTEESTGNIIYHLEL
jgi:RimJ/RimL family protein N-acetyltransferase